MSLADLEEWRSLLNLAKRPSVKTQIELIIANLESSVLPSNNVEKVKSPVYTTVTSFSWDQTAKFVTVLIPVKEEPSDVKVEVSGQSLDVKFSSSSKNYQLKLKKLNSTVLNDSSWKWKSGFLQVKLTKENERNWTNLTADEQKASANCIKNAGKEDAKSKN